LETCVASAVIDFNDGVSGIVEIFEHMSIKPGKVLINFCNASNAEQIAEAETQNSKIVKLRRKQLRGLRKGYLDKEDEIENERLLMKLECSSIGIHSTFYNADLEDFRVSFTSSD